MLDKKFFLALAVLIGTIVGAGIFGLPFVISKSGLLPGLFYFLVLGAAVLILHLIFGEIVLRTEEKYRFSGYSEKYLGKKGLIVATISTFIGATGTLLAYIIIGGNFLKIILSPVRNLSSFRFGLIFWLFLVYFIFKGIKLIAPIEIFTNSAFFIAIFIILCFLLPQISVENLELINPKNFFLPYGAIMFSLTGFAAIPEIAAILKTSEERKSFKKVIITSALISIVLYIIFSLAVVGVSGKNTSGDAFSGLSFFLGPKIIVLGALFGLITIADSFLMVCLYFKNSLINDYNLSEKISSSIVAFLPVLLFLRFQNFPQIIGFVGTILGTIESVLILMIFKKAKVLGNRGPEYALNIPNILIYSLIIILFMGAFFQLLFA